MTRDNSKFLISRPNVQWMWRILFVTTYQIAISHFKDTVWNTVSIVCTVKNSQLIGKLVATWKSAITTHILLWYTPILTTIHVRSTCSAKVAPGFITWSAFVPFAAPLILKGLGFSTAVAKIGKITLLGTYFAKYFGSFMLQISLLVYGCCCIRLQVTGLRLKVFHAWSVICKTSSLEVSCFRSTDHKIFQCWLCIRLQVWG